MNQYLNVVFFTTDNLKWIHSAMQSFPYAISNFTSAVHDKLNMEYRGQPDGFVQVGLEKFVLFQVYKDFADVIYNFETRPDDVFVCTHPRSGTTWTQEMVWLICNNLDYESARSEVLNKGFPCLERHIWFNDSNIKSSSLFDSVNYKGMVGPMYNKYAEQTTQRFFKTHLPIELLPRNINEVGAKIVYVARNPKDVAVSYYYWNKMNPCLGFNGDFQSFVEQFLEAIYGPYWQHILNGWSHRNDENVFFMFYENLKIKTEETLRKLSNFLGKSVTDDALHRLLNHLEFENFKANPSVNFKVNEEETNNNSLVRRGKVGGNPEISKEISKKFDDWIKVNLSNSDLEFPHCSEIY